METETSITFYGGVHEIGGNKFLIEDKGTKIFLDFGMQMGKVNQYCTIVQIYNTFKRKLVFAVAGTLTDYMENKPTASSIVSRFDRQFLMLESTVLSYDFCQTE